ncbi:GPI ethanolamine phosphate transferase 2 [Trichinella pseudospiralis]|uniref:GPI ethanolamine phosphate transferase 2 n=1 Tax=Trichinella pseudospiralis TaxID=6337 RepID=A0A0V1F8U3_TRIPS|nr:GPI ethanolamine phosphate transferase 2 [Trichinella pseudospiralis]
MINTDTITNTTRQRTYTEISSIHTTSYYSTDLKHRLYITGGGPPRRQVTGPQHWYIAGGWLPGHLSVVRAGFLTMDKNSGASRAAWLDAISYSFRKCDHRFGDTVTLLNRQNSSVHPKMSNCTSIKNFRKAITIFGLIAYSPCSYFCSVWVSFLMKLAIYLRVSCIIALISLTGFLWEFLEVRFDGTQEPVGNFEKDHICEKISVNNISEASVDKIVLIVVDAFRNEFFNSQPENFPFITSMMKQNCGLPYTAKVHMPTVTLPRIKTLISGSIPSYIDLLYNIGSTEYKFNKDNIIARLKAAGNNIVFYGDETWIRLFPKSFLRSDGTKSLIVGDFKEVDNNVTRWIDFEMANDDWSLMILHYLGLDHIGHSLGDKSPLIPVKLEEMDLIAKKIYKALNQKSNNFLIVVTADHGMSDGGSHGDASDFELYVPLLFLSPKLSAQNTSKVVRQVDLAPTLALLFKLPIPTTSVGFLLPGLIDQLMPTKNDICLAYLLNLCQLQTVSQAQFQKNISDAIMSSGEECHAHSTSGCPVKDCSEKMLENLLGIYDNIRERNQQSDSSFNLFWMVLPIFGMMISVFLLCICIFNIQHIRPTNLLVVVVFWAQVASLASSSYIENEFYVWKYSFIFMMTFSLFTDVPNRRKDFAVISTAIVLTLNRVTENALFYYVKPAQVGNCFELFTGIVIQISLPILCGIFVLIRMRVYSSRLFTRRILILFNFIFAAFHRLFVTTPSRIVYALCMSLLLVECSASSVTVCILCVGCVLLNATYIGVYMLLLLEELFLAVTQKFMRRRIDFRTVLYHIFARYSFFALGNSNSLSTLNMSAAFTGVNGYSLIVNGILLTLHTFLGPITVWSLYYRAQNKQQRMHTLPLIVWLHVVPLLFYMIVITWLRHHLFIWSVFAPKLFYLAAENIICLVLALFVSYFIYP